MNCSNHIIQYQKRFKIISKILFNALQKYGNFKGAKKMTIYKIMGDVIFSNWLVFPLFSNPVEFGLIHNKNMDKLCHIFSDLSQVVNHIMKGTQILETKKDKWI
jgi:hypothetical protein